MKEGIEETTQKEGAFEVDESYFGARQGWENEAEEQIRKTAVFCLLKRDDNV